MKDDMLETVLACGSKEEADALVKVFVQQIEKRYGAIPVDAHIFVVNGLASDAYKQGIEAERRLFNLTGILYRPWDTGHVAAITQTAQERKTLPN